MSLFVALLLCLNVRDAFALDARVTASALLYEGLRLGDGALDAAMSAASDCTGSAFAASVSVCASGFAAADAAACVTSVAAGFAVTSSSSVNASNASITSSMAVSSPNSSEFSIMVASAADASLDISKGGMGQASACVAGNVAGNVVGSGSRGAGDDSGARGVSGDNLAEGAVGIGDFVEGVPDVAWSFAGVRLKALARARVTVPVIFGE